MTTAVVRFTGAALDDLRGLAKKDPQIVRQVLKKCLLLERNPYAGEELLGSLIGFRKLVVGNRDWRIVWRIIDDGTVSVEVSEVWAVGARADEEVYTEMRRRIAAMPDHPLTHALDQVVGLLAPQSGIEAASEPLDDPIPGWLMDRLMFSAGLRRDELDGMTGAEAADLWDRYMRDGTV